MKQQALNTMCSCSCITYLHICIVCSSNSCWQLVDGGRIKGKRILTFSASVEFAQISTQLQFVETAAAVKENFLTFLTMTLVFKVVGQACKSNSNVRKELCYKNLIGIQNSFTRHAHCISSSSFRNAVLIHKRQALSGSRNV